jgi:hypothetical protein
MDQEFSSLAREQLLRLVRAIRPEEWILFVLWLLVAGLCFQTGTSIDFQWLFIKYLRHFGSYALVMIGVSRVVFLYVDDWHPSDERKQRFKRMLFGEPGDHTKTLRNDLELMRGLLILFANLSLYSNLKARIPFIDPTIGDDIFIQVDAVLFGAGSAEALVNFTKARPEFADWLGGVYRHDYIWMVGLLWVAYFRRDARAMRWIFGATALTYMVAILITVMHPSYGPFFLESDRFAWANDTPVGQPQRSLKRFYYGNLAKVEQGEEIYGKIFLGIAAFPSLHVGHMCIMGIIALRLAPLYAVWLAGVTLVTWMATVAFGWHYWVDALGGAAIAIVCTEFVWWLIRYGTGSDGDPPSAPPDEHE